MATFHWHMQVIRRGDGRSAVAASAYRSGARLVDARTGLVHDFHRRRGVGHSEIILPAGADLVLADRAHLWNQAEAWERRRRNAVVAREAVVALPHELPQVAQIALLRGHAEHIAASLGVAVDVALHLPGEQRPRRALAAAGLPGGDPRNTHGHLLWTTRRVAGPNAGHKTRELDDRKTGSAIVEALRTDWEQRVNTALREASIEARVDRRSRAARGDATAPMPKLGPAAAAMERKGIATERGEAWRMVRDGNAALADVERVIHELQGQRDALQQQHSDIKQRAEEVGRLLARRQELAREIRPLRPSIDMDTALDRVSGGEYRRLRRAAATAREHERRAQDRMASLRWWQVIPRWHGKQQAARWAARRLSIERALADNVDAWMETAAQMVAEDKDRHGREAAAQDEIQRVITSIGRRLSAAHRKRRALTEGWEAAVGCSTSDMLGRDCAR